MQPAPGATSRFTAPSGAWTAITPKTVAHTIAFGVDPSDSNWASATFLVSRPGTDDSNARTIAPQISYLMESSLGPYVPGQVACYVKPSVTVSMYQDEA